MRYFTLISLFLLFNNCKKEFNNIDLGLDFYPTEIGFWQEYSVDSISFSDFTNPISIDTSQYFLREEIESSFLDLHKDKNFRIEQFKKTDSTDWKINNVFTLKASNTNLQKVGNDLRFIKLVFPPENDKTWNGNVYIDAIDAPSLDFYNPKKYNWSYSYSEVNSSQQIGEFTFDSCITIIQIDEENLFEKKYSKEIYAKHVGLVYKELKILKTQAPPSNLPFEERAENGFILKYTISDYHQL